MVENVSLLAKIGRFSLLLLCFWLPVTAAAAGAPVAVFPLQDLSKGLNEVNLPFTIILADRLAASGNEISSHETVIAFMANNRIRNVGHLESFHIARVGDELGAAFILLGTVSQFKEQPVPSVGLTLQLVRTSDSRTMWSYIGNLSTDDARKVLGIGEPRSAAELQPLLLDDIVTHWPWEIISEMQKAGSISIDSIRLQPSYVRPGGEVYARVRFRNDWPAGRSPRVFFKADEQIHAASVSADGAYEASWIAGKKDGRFPVSLLLEWPLYGRTENTILGAYLVDGTPPLFELDLRGTQQHGDIPVFRHELIIMPRMLVRKPLARWRLAFFDDTDNSVGVDEGSGNMPEIFTWLGRNSAGRMVEDGLYKVVLDVWDQAGNTASASRRVALNRGAPEVALAVARNGREMLVDLAHDGKVPLAFWRMEMWSREGRIIKTVEGRELPAKIGIELPSADEGEEVRGLLLVQDILGNRGRQKIQDLFLLAGNKEAEKDKEEKPASLSETWVDEF
jgi:TolB-like protein